MACAICASVAKPSWMMPCSGVRLPTFWERRTRSTCSAVSTRRVTRTWRRSGPSGVLWATGAGFRGEGVDMGPCAFRVGGIDQKIRSLGYEVVDAGDLPVKIAETQVPGDPHLKYLK